ncbi:MAG TPA: DedA family protein [Ktedonobacterales bacterium]|nr:DedA family protein [Ktedonobacterales bacterium]
MEQFIQHVLQVMGTVPAVAVYGIIAVWVGLESSGIGVPIEPLMLFAGSLTAQAQASVNLILAIIVATVGCLVFSAVAYLIGDRLGTQAITRVGRYVGLTQARADHIELWLRHRGMLGVFIARETPMVRTYGSFIMGAAKIGLPTFLLGTAAGSLLYCGVVTIVGAALGKNYAQAIEYFAHFGTVGAVVVVVMLVAVLVIHHFWGRLTLHRIALHFHRHHAQHKLAQAHERDISAQLPG